MDLYTTYQLLSILGNNNYKNGFGAGSQYGGGSNSLSQGISFWNAMQNVSGTDNSNQSRQLAAPASMDSIFEGASSTYGVDVNLLKAIGKAESDFDPSCTSSAGAMGVMQLMPCNVEELGIKDPYNVRENIMGGAKHFAQMLKKYNGDVELALAGYNAGSGNVAKYGGVPPFKETQNYIKKVMSYAGDSINTGRTVQDQGITDAQSAAGSVYAGEGNANSYFQYLVEISRLTTQMRMSSMMAQAMNGTDNSMLL